VSSFIRSRFKRVSVRPFQGPSRYVNPQTVTMDVVQNQTKPNGEGEGEGDSEVTKTKRWDMIGGHDSVSVVIYHKDRDAAVLVRQFRPPVWANAKTDGDRDLDLDVGLTYELCAGLVDKDPSMSLEEIAKEEIREECGFDVDASSLTRVTTYIHACGHIGTRETIFFTQVDDSMRVVGGGGGLLDEGEAIEVLALPMHQLEAFATDPALPKSPAAIIGLLWLVQHWEKRQRGRVETNA